MRRPKEYMQRRPRPGAQEPYAGTLSHARHAQSTLICQLLPPGVQCIRYNHVLKQSHDAGRPVDASWATAHLQHRVAWPVVYSTCHKRWPGLTLPLIAPDSLPSRLIEHRSSSNEIESQEHARLLMGTCMIGWYLAIEFPSKCAGHDFILGL